MVFVVVEPLWFLLAGGLTSRWGVQQRPIDCLDRLWIAKQGGPLQELSGQRNSWTAGYTPPPWQGTEGLPVARGFFFEAPPQRTLSTTAGRKQKKPTAGLPVGVWGALLSRIRLSNFQLLEPHGGVLKTPCWF